MLDDFTGVIFIEFKLNVTIFFKHILDLRIFLLSSFNNYKTPYYNYILQSC